MDLADNPTIKALSATEMEVFQLLPAVDRAMVRLAKEIIESRGST